MALVFSAKVLLVGANTVGTGDLTLRIARCICAVDDGDGEV